MNNFIIKSLVLFLISSNSFAQFTRFGRVAMPDLNEINSPAFQAKYKSYENMSKAMSVVEVLGDGKGSGVLVVMDEKVVVVTNSHILQGK
ncbi:MAG: hypothetical protein K2Q18_15590, partial [Bdellovibrionales bacterium]|nr:hypothetical protein [Bdellovibrionales bacterium]